MYKIIFQTMAFLICINASAIESKAILIEPINSFEKEAANPAEAYLLKSKYFINNRKVIVQTPLSYKQNSNKDYPVLYLLDGKSKLKHVQFTAQILASKRKVPELIIVSIPAEKSRQQDFTPNYLHKHSSQDFGDADNFSQFLKEELIPFIDRKYRTVPYRILTGHSRSGLYVVNEYIKNETSLFQAYFAFSPALWPNEFKIIDKASESMKVYSKKGYLHISVGEQENDKMKASYQKMVSILDNSNSKFKYQVEVLNDESHSTTPIIGHHRALRNLYINWDQPWQQFEDHGLSVINPQFKQLSKEFGYEVVPDARALNSIGYRYLKNKELQKAQKAFEMNIEFYPNSANAYDSLADALESQGKIKKAKNIMQKALTLINKDDLNYNSIYQHWQRLKQQK